MALTTRPPMLRRTRARVLTGAAAGIADHFGIDRRWVRVGFAVAAVFGVGVVLYLAASLVMPGDDDTPAPATRWRLSDPIDVLALGAVITGGVLLARELAPSGAVLLLAPLIVAVVALALLVSWPHAGAPDRPADLPDWVPPAAATAIGVLQTRRGLLLRAVLGGLLVLSGTAALLGATKSWSQLRTGFLALTVIAAGIALVFGPWLGRLGGELAAERRARIRSQERAEMAVHLHDSVLQTLAMVQRRAGDPGEVVRLARKQERELRAWLLSGRDASAPAQTFAAAIDAYAAELEDANGVAVEVVHVLDCPLDEPLHAMALAAREAISNAQRHAGVATVSVYTEVEPDGVRVYIRDRGAGFDREAVPPDRRGLAESIEGRVRRHGGRAVVRTAPGQGTEIELTMPRRSEA